MTSIHVNNLSPVNVPLQAKTVVQKNNVQKIPISGTSEQPSLNGQNLPSAGPIVLGNSKDLILTNREFLYYFSDLTNKNKVLDGICLIWKSGNLFSQSGSPSSSFYKRYNEFLKDVVKANGSEFSNYVKKLHVNSNNFTNEFFSLSNHSSLNELQKSICLTQALELALLGIDSTPVLTNINSNCVVETKSAEGTKTVDDYTKGYRNELLAAWFLAKFIFQLNPSSSNKFILSEKFPTHKRNYDGEGNPVYGALYRREIDMLGKDFIASVKSGGNHFPQQISNLFFVVIDDKNLDLKNTTKKIFLLKTAEEEKQYSPEYLKSMQYKEIKNKAVTEAKDIIEKFANTFRCDDKCLQKLISKEGIEIYYLPAVNDFQSIKKFIEQNYEKLEKESLVEEKIA